MKNYKKISIIILILSSFFAQANDTLFINSEIKRATVYPEGARLSRIGNTKVSTGTTTIVFENITDKFSTKGIQIKCDKNVKLLDIMTRKNYANVKETNKKISSLTSNQKTLQRSMGKSQTILQVFIKEEKMILANQTVVSRQVDLSIEEITKIAEFYRKRLSEISAEKIRINRQIKSQQNKINTILKQLNELNARRKTVTNEIVVSLSSSKVQNLKLTAEYYTNNAGWTPIYDIRVDDISKPVTLVYKAEVFQNTSNDWKNIDVKLSTSNPSQTNTKPVILPWTLHFVSHRNSVSRSKNNTGRTSFVFNIENKYSIPSDGKKHSLEINKYMLNAEYEYFAVPKKDTKAYLTARVTEWEKYHLLNGKTNLFFEGTMIGESVLDLNTASDTIDISLGEDKNIVIERENLKSFNKKQYAGNKQIDERAFEIKVRNNKNREIKLRIEDQIPVSKNNKIDVKLISAEQGEVTETDGKITWILKQAPNKSTTLKFHYSVKYPKSERVELE